MGYLSANINAGVSRAHAERNVSLRDVTIAQMENGVTECRWRHAPEAHGGFWGFWKSQSNRVETCLGRRRLAFACSPKPGQWPLWRVPHVLVVQMKSQNRKNVYLSPYVEDSLNSKGNKKFRTWTEKSLRVFRISWFLCARYIWYEHYMSISHIHVWLWYIKAYQPLLVIYCQILFIHIYIK